MISTPTTYTSPPFTVDLKEHLNQSERINMTFRIQIKGESYRKSTLFLYVCFFPPKRKHLVIILLSQRQSYLSWNAQATLGAAVTGPDFLFSSPVLTACLGVPSPSSSFCCSSRLPSAAVSEMAEYAGARSLSSATRNQGFTCHKNSEKFKHLTDPRNMSRGRT
jgi:hypothetical protein